MKKFWSILLIVVALCVAVPSHAQFQWGVRGGVSLAKASFKGGNLKSDNFTGFFIGPTAEFTLPLLGIGVDVSALYNQFGIDTETGSTTKKSIEIPVNLKWTIGFSSVLGAYIAAGPQFGFNVGNKTVSEVAKFKSSNVTWNVGIGARVLGHLEAGVGYNIALSNFGELVPDQLRGTKNDFKSNTWQVQVAYLF